MSSATETIASTTGGFTEDAFHHSLKGRDEPAWLVERRREAFARFQAFPRPGPREEEWRRTDIRALKLDAFSPPTAGEPTAEAIAAFDDQWGALSSHYATGMLHVGGAVAREPDATKLGGAVFVDLAKAAKDYPEILDRYLLTQAVTPADDFFAALHAAFWTGGSLLYVPKGVKLDAPLFSLVGLSREWRRRHQPHARRARGRRRGHAGPRDGRLAAATSRARPCTPGRSRSSWRRARGSGW